ncbi:MULTISPECIES: hypothetical protein [unclassified Streptomyces]|uniref:hypothetical protein n=1 Tax=unclassified Streptomyces TaxID=2593676 RepID=UPI002E816617|nr:hypothetical protein [Streptomyces sp. NBC_00562]WTC76946.1 hypothetical protein OH719_02565 [Streptomyces sp. NBC_01653]WTD93913.1 hypothetical protein OG891_44290 [Streptomyces sp. NBC_01637]WUC24937.1 hypothetical protein OHA33_42925 [Streptomyces sp. NBC_00562]
MVDGEGHADADALREEVGKLNGPTIALSRAMPRGVKEGWWPEGTEAPITVVYGGAETSSWRQAEAYEMSSENVPIFRTAFERLADGRARSTWTAEAFGGRTVPRAHQDTEGENAHVADQDQPDIHTGIPAGAGSRRG